MLSSNCVVAVPPFVNDIADSLGWLLWEVPFSLATSYATIAINLFYVCECNNNGHIHPFVAHFKLVMLAMSNIMPAFLPAQHENAMIMLRLYLGKQWGHRISFVGFQHLLLESYTHALNLHSFCIFTNVMLSFHFLFFF
jgi:hypothetical protein